MSTVSLEPGTRFGLADAMEPAQVWDMPVTLYTRTHLIRGRCATRLHRLTDLLEGAVSDLVVLTEVMIDEHGRTASPLRVPFAQVRLEAVLFAVADVVPESHPGPGLVTTPEVGLVLIPPFTLTGHLASAPGLSLIHI